MKVPNLLQVSFSYPHARRDFGVPDFHVSLHVDERAEEKALCYAESKVEETLNAAGIRWIHAYSWPDGSLYKYIEVAVNPDGSVNPNGSGSLDETWAKLCDLPAWKTGDIKPREKYLVNLTPRTKHTDACMYPLGAGSDGLCDCHMAGENEEIARVTERWFEKYPEKTT